MVHLHDVDVENADEGGGPDRRHQKPVINSRVSQVNHEKVVRSLMSRESVKELNILNRIFYLLRYRPGLSEPGRTVEPRRSS